MSKKPKEEVAVIPSVQSSVVESQDPSSLLVLAIKNNLDVDKLERLMSLQEKYLERKARESFFLAMAEFQYSCPVIKKTKKVGYDPKEGGQRIEYFYAPLEGIEAQIKKPLKDNGLSYRWEIQDVKEGPAISVTCRITHKDGHSESTTMTAAQDASGKKNNIQQRGSTVTYLKRYTLLGALGIGSADADVDGRGTVAAPSDGDVIIKPQLNDERFQKALKGVLAGTIKASEVRKYALTDDQERALQTTEKQVK